MTATVPYCNPMEDRGSVHLVQAREREAGAHPEIGGNFPLDQAVIQGWAR